MSFITPDISLFQPKGLPQETPQATDPSQIAKLLQEMAGHGQEGMLQELVRQGMTKGLGSDRAASTTDTGRLNFQQDGGGAVGYAGPLRQSDRPMDTVVPTMRPEQAPVVEELQRNRNSGLDKIFQMLGLTRGSDDAQAGLINKVFPGLVPPPAPKANPRQEQADNRLFESIGEYVHKKRVTTAAEDFPDTQPDPSIIRREYVKLKPDQRTNLDALKGLDHQIEKYESLIGRLGLPEGEGMVSTAKGGLDLKTRRMRGDPDVAELDALRSEITAIARAFGGDSRVSNDEMRRLDKAVISDFDNKKSAQASINVLKDFRNAKAGNLPVPGLHNRKTWGTENKSQSSGGVTMKAPDGSTRQVPQDQVQRFLQRGAVVVE